MSQNYTLQKSQLNELVKENLIRRSTCEKELNLLIKSQVYYLF